MVRKVLCFQLDTVTMIVGWLGVVISLTGMTISALSIGFAEQIAKWFISLAPEEGGASTQDPVEIKTHLIIASTINIVLCSVNLIASFCLILGTLKERHLLLLPWLVNSAISIIFSFIYNALMVARVIEVALLSGLAMMLFATLILAFEVYIWLAIHTHFKTLQAKTFHQRQKLLSASAASYPSYTKL
ncbi:uncharacterized protein LOC118744982 [Rhagoletis pomonella]|uniref:uncharacterized protein LOC118744982 n=1 Tax=Rhagoletis pomonella TaxID=28610 RepID=UPI001784E759|nr:uncharacterized protein LOC118744982 [Rhagoletis pomonella]